MLQPFYAITIGQEVAILSVLQPQLGPCIGLSYLTSKLHVVSKITYTKFSSNFMPNLLIPSAQNTGF